MPYLAETEIAVNKMHRELIDRLEVLVEMAYGPIKEGFEIALEVITKYPYFTVPIIIHNDHDQILFNLYSTIDGRKVER